MSEKRPIVPLFLSKHFDPASILTQLLLKNVVQNGPQLDEVARFFCRNCCCSGNLNPSQWVTLRSSWTCNLHLRCQRDPVCGFQTCFIRDPTYTKELLRRFQPLFEPAASIYGDIYSMYTYTTHMHIYTRWIFSRLKDFNQEGNFCCFTALQRHLVWLPQKVVVHFSIIICDFELQAGRENACAHFHSICADFPWRVQILLSVLVQCIQVYLKLEWLHTQKIPPPQNCIHA